MNQTTRRSFGMSSLLLVGTVLFLGACGPENLDDPNVVSQMMDQEDKANKEIMMSAQMGDLQQLSKDMEDESEMSKGALEHAPGQGYTIPATTTSYDVSHMSNVIGLYGLHFAPTTWGVRQNCAPWMSGGFYRFCGRVNRP